MDAIILAAAHGISDRMTSLSTTPNILARFRDYENREASSYVEYESSLSIPIFQCKVCYFEVGFFIVSFT